MRKGWTEVALGEVMVKTEDTVIVRSDTSYPNLGIFGQGRGSFTKPPISGSSTSAQTLFRVRAGQFIYSRLFAFEGAYAVVEESQDGFFVSNEFPSFKLDQRRILPGYLRAYFRRPSVWNELASQSTGLGNRRQRIHPEVILAHCAPLPPLAEQQRLVAHLDAIESRLTRAQKLREEAAAEAQAFTISLHHHLSKGGARRLDELLTLDEEQESIKPEGSYPQVGIRSFGEGMFRKPPTLGSETTYRAFNVLRAGKLVMSQVKGWEGAVAVCPADLDGWFVSPEYRTFACNENECVPDYLAHLVKTRWFQQHLAEATRGVGARRERIRPEMLLGIEISFPDLEGQKTALKSIEHLTQAQSLADQSAPHAEALLPSLLDHIFNS